jgi:U32 family peptidase
MAAPQTSDRTIALTRPELLAPAGNWECARAAIENGADAIYFGLDRFNARMRAENFTEADLPDLMGFLHRRGVKGYVTMNTLIFPQELAEAEQYLRSMISAGVDAAIVQDVGICRLIRHLSPDFPIHASTQMTVTSAAGVKFAQELGCQLVVLARETSLKDIDRIQQQTAQLNVALPLEVFVHGALCVAYSGQCLTSEALGGRSANRGECAQACRMPYDLIANGQEVDLGGRQYLLSPQDLSGLDVLPEIIQSGVTCLKIEGRLKAPEYVANVTRVYRQAIDAIVDQANTKHDATAERYNLEMAFSRGLYPGWFEGIDNQALVHAEFGKKRGVYLGDVVRIQSGYVTIVTQIPLKPGDGVVFDCGHPETREEGGRIYTVDRSRGQRSTHEVTLTFGNGAIDFRRIEVGDRLWKTSDPELDKQIRQTYAQENSFQRPIQIEVHGAVEQPLVVIARDECGNIVQVASAMSLVEAHNKPLTADRLLEQLGRLGNTPLRLEDLANHLQGDVLVPVSELNRMRRDIVDRLMELRSHPKKWQLNVNTSHTDLLKVPLLKGDLGDAVSGSNGGSPTLQHPPQLKVLIRQLRQINAVLSTGVTTIYCEFEDPRRYQEAVQTVRDWNTENATSIEIWVVPPRITKPGETWILEQVQKSDADGYLVRNYDHLAYFADHRCIGDFSLNVANGIAADYFKQKYELEKLTASYDLNINQLDDLLSSTPADWFDITIHQHMPMFHMEHCVFCAFLSDGTDFTNCGRPCDTQQVKLRDRVGTEHILQADAGCRNTVFNGKAQTGAEHVQRLIDRGARHFRIDFLTESAASIQCTIGYYQQLLNGEINGVQLWKALQLQSQLGVTRGTIEKR